MEVDNESGADEDAGDEVQNVKDLELLQRLHLSNDGDDDIPPSEHGDDYITCVIVMMRPMIQLIPMMMIISNTCMICAN